MVRSFDSGRPHSAAHGYEGDDEEEPGTIVETPLEPEQADLLELSMTPEASPLEQAEALLAMPETRNPAEADRRIADIHKLQTQISDPNVQDLLSQKVKELNIITKEAESSKRPEFKDAAILGRKGPFGS